jgi:hypothetical protein
MPSILDVLAIALPLLPLVFGVAIIHVALKRKRAVDRHYEFVREHNRLFWIEALAQLRQKGLLA